MWERADAQFYYPKEGRIWLTFPEETAWWAGQPVSNSQLHIQFLLYDILSMSERNSLIIRQRSHSFKLFGFPYVDISPSVGMIVGLSVLLYIYIEKYVGVFFQLHIYVYMFKDVRIWNNSPDSHTVVSLPLPARTVLLAMLATSLGISFMVENPGSSLMPYFHRWTSFAMTIRDLWSQEGLAGKWHL